MDTLWLDAAWFSVGFPGGVGNYSFAPGYPRGLGPVADRAHANGLRFLVWFEPERVNCYSETYHEHPEDVIVLDSRNSVNCLYNIGDPAARRRLTERLKSHICGDRLDIYRQDFNMCPSGYWRTADVPGRKGMTQIRFVEGHYAMWDALLEAFPGLLIDNCASGGRRLDLETCRRSVPLWRSDTGCSPVTDTHRGHTWSQNQILALTRYLPYHTCGTWSAEPYDVRSTASGGVACDLDVLHPDFQPEAVIPQMEEVKRLRSYWYGDFYPLTQPDNAETVWAAWQLSLGCSGVVYAFRRDACAQETCSLRLTALEKEATYRVTVTDEKMKKTQCVLSGAALETFTVSCPQPRSSVVVEYEKQV
jgi:alpha-galactosidase